MDMMSFEAKNTIRTGLAATTAALLLTGCGHNDNAQPVETASVVATTGAPTPDLPPSTSSPLAGTDLLVLDTNPAKAAVAEHPELALIAEQPTASWLYDDSVTVLTDLQKTLEQADQQHKTPVIVVYNLPDRDCGGYSAGGSTDLVDYKNFINSVYGIIGDRQAVTIIEPDALAFLSDPKCSPQDAQDQRFAAIAYAAGKLNTVANHVYVDASHPNWISPATMATYLTAIDVAQNADGIAVNVSNYYPDAANQAYVQAISQAIGYNLHYVEDTSRNGNPEFNGEWCNPPDRIIGQLPTTQTGIADADAYVWANLAGGSDGECNGGGAAGSWDATRAVTMLPK